MIDYKSEYDKVCVILRTFDENLTHKCSKGEIILIKEKIDKECARKEEQVNFMSSIIMNNMQMEGKIEEQNQIIELLQLQLRKHITKEIKKATMELKGSFIEDEVNADAWNGASVNGKSSPKIDGRLSKIMLDQQVQNQKKEFDIEQSIRNKANK